jgi:tRNA(Ile)-lysidine synthase TilS/MesJ
MKSLDPLEFNQYIVNQAREVIIDYKLIKPKDKIAVGLSGGKDSVLTLYLLADLVNELDFELVAISIDEGISGYRGEGINIARTIASKLDVELVEGSLKEEFGFTLDEVKDLYQSACIPCGVFRRYLLNKISNELGADKLATGHNLDDEIQSPNLALNWIGYIQNSHLE